MPRRPRGRARTRHALVRAGACLLGVLGPCPRDARSAEPPAASQPDAYVARPRVLVMTDIANEPDDQMSLVRFLVYSNGFDVEGIVATTSTWMKRAVGPT